MRWGRRTVLPRLESRAGGLRRVALNAALAGLLLALIVGGVAPHQGRAVTIPSVSTPTVSVPAMTVPKPTNLPTPTVPTVTLPKPTVPTPTDRRSRSPSRRCPSRRPRSECRAFQGRRSHHQPAGRSAVERRPGADSRRAQHRMPVARRRSLDWARRRSRDRARPDPGWLGRRPPPASGRRRRTARGARAGPPRQLLSQRSLRKLVSQHHGCLSSLAPRQSRVLVLRTGIGIKHAYSRQQVAKILRVTLPQEGRLERQAVTGLTDAATNGRCGTPLGALGSAVHFAARAMLSLFAGSSPTGATSTAARPSPTQRAPAARRSRSTAGRNPRPAAPNHASAVLESRRRSTAASTGSCSSC